MNLAIVGGGPAGLRAAEVAAAEGVSVTLYDAKPSVGRKFLLAGNGGLNLTRAESPERMATRYVGAEMPEDVWPSLITDFDAAATRAWAASLGVETFAASSGRVYPMGLKSAHLLRAWLSHLRARGVAFRTRHRWTGITFSDGSRHPGGIRLDFAVGPEGKPVSVETQAVIFALGGGSWPKTGSDGEWIRRFASMEIGLSPLEPANCGWEVPWSDTVLKEAEGLPLKNLNARAGTTEAAGELVVTRYGLEGSALYALGPVLRELHRANGTAELELDFKPDFTVDQLVAKLGTLGKDPADLLPEAHNRWRLGPAVAAILASRGPYASPLALANETKHCRLFLTRPRPLEEAISSAGGVRWSELNRTLMLRRFPGMFLAGEMIDWEAPTGGYLLQGCFATGTRAGRRAAEWLRSCG
ncbi:MAG: NAD(P)/FAD-dependent oxidoreductase [Chthoniobacteraceae bacterium]